MFSVSKGTFALAITQLFAGAHAGLKTCTDTSNLSCHNSTAVSDLCCFNSPGGTLMQVQFWDTDPSTGPSDSWTIHGLWPDHCDGGYGEYCDDSREVDDIESVLKDQGRTELLDYMQTYWISDSESNNKFWAHEWNAHGTCVNTIDPSCYTDYSEHEEVGDFFEQVVTLFKDLDTYTALSKAGIKPTNDKTYTAKEIQSAVGSIHDGYEVTLLCNDDTLYEIEYYFNVYGSAVGGKYVATSPLSKSGCPSSGIKYPPKNSSSNRE